MPSVWSLGIAALMMTPHQVGHHRSALPGEGKTVVLIAGDEEYRSEEALPQLAAILSKRLGFRTVLSFSVDAQGFIDPEAATRQTNLDMLAKADLCILHIRFRKWPDALMKAFVDYYRSGRPILALRTSTHAFDLPESSPFARFGWRSSEWPGGFGRHVLGETWVSHWGVHGRQATRGRVEPSAKGHPILRGVKDVFGTTDVYEAAPPPDCNILMRGEVVDGMNPTDPPARGRKRTATGVEQSVNEPMMPIAWTRLHRNEAGRTNRILTVTMGAATDLLNEGFRRLVVNGALWCVGSESKITPRLNVSLVEPYAPSPFGFGGFKRGLRPTESSTPMCSKT